MQSQRVLILSERFGLELAKDLDEVGSSKLWESENISMNSYMHLCTIHQCENLVCSVLLAYFVYVRMPLNME